MVVTPLNLITLPLVLAVWTLDAFLWLVLLRIALGRLAPRRFRGVLDGLSPLTDPARLAIDRRICRCRNRPSPSWLPWLVLIAALLIARHLLVWIALSIP